MENCGFENESSGDNKYQISDLYTIKDFVHSNYCTTQVLCCENQFHV